MKLISLLLLIAIVATGAFNVGLTQRPPSIDVHMKLNRRKKVEVATTAEEAQPNDVYSDVDVAPAADAIKEKLAVPEIKVNTGAIEDAAVVLLQGASRAVELSKEYQLLDK